MTTEEKAKQLIVNVSRGKVAKENIAPESDLRNDLGLDSLSIAELLVLTEEAFGISIDIGDVQEARTFGQMLAYIGGSAKA